MSWWRWLRDRERRLTSGTQQEILADIALEVLAFSSDSAYQATWAFRRVNSSELTRTGETHGRTGRRARASVFGQRLALL
jgi:hypothetical protein